MKNLLLILTCFLFYRSSAQINPAVPVDTVSSGAMAFIYDSTVISYTVTIITDGILLEKNCTGPLCPLDIGTRLLYLKPGSKVIYDNRKRRAPNGGTTRLPDKIFIIRK